MSEIDWDKENISTKKWLEPELSKASIFHDIQYLGLQRLNVVQLDKMHLTKRNVYGLICVSNDELKLLEEKPFIFDDDAHFFGPTQISTQNKENSSQRKRIFQQNIENADMTINLINFALLASPTNFGERCGPVLQRYFDSKMEAALADGNNLLSSIVPVAFVHNFTAMKFPVNPYLIIKPHVTYFGFYRSTVSFDKADDRILKIDPSGDLIEFQLSNSGILHFCTSMQNDGVTQIYAVVEDNSKELIEELSEMRQRKKAENNQTVSLDASNLFNQSTVNNESITEEYSLSALADVTAASENFLEAYDYDLIIEDEKGTKLPEPEEWAIDLSKSSVEEEDREKRFKQLIKEVSAGKHEFKKLWFEGMEDYELLVDPEYNAFLKFYRDVTFQETKERAIRRVEEEASKAVVRKEPIVADREPKESEKENATPSYEKFPMAQIIPQEDSEQESQTRKRRASISPVPPPKTPKTTKRKRRS